ncbi:MAG: ATP-binding protein [Bacteroidetes bacterium]|nr:ATP-binding protein [Bacteroidota bacterium]
MKFNKKISPHTWILVSSITLIVVQTTFFIFSSLLLHLPFDILPLLITDAGVFLIAYFFFRFILEKFIYSKIKLIFKTIHTFKSSQKKMEIDLHQDIISDVNQEVLNWAQDKKDEIKELKEMELYRREFLGNVSHELKTPLFNIQGYVMTLLDGGLDDKSINHDYLERSRKNIERMISIVEDLENISRLETGQLQVEIRKFDIASLSKEVIELLEIKARNKQIQLRLRSEAGNVYMADGDKEKIRQVLINLIDNSIKYGKEGGNTKISFFDMDENWLIEITDNGIGIEERDIPRVFERFYRVDKSRSREQGGSGLGLAIVKHIIEAHDQTINVRSTVGIGTTFAFTLKKA